MVVVAFWSGSSWVKARREWSSMATCRATEPGCGQAAASAVGAQGDLLIAGQALDVEVEQITRVGMLVAHDGRGGMQVAPAVEMARRRMRLTVAGTEAGGAGDLVAGRGLAAQGDDLIDQGGGVARGLRRGREERSRSPRGPGADSGVPIWRRFWG